MGIYFKGYGMGGRTEIEACMCQPNSEVQNVKGQSRTWVKLGFSVRMEYVAVRWKELRND